MAVGALEGHVFVDETAMGLAISVDGEVLHVTSVMTFRILESMLLVVGIEMRACRLEVGRIALRVLVNVNSMHAGRQIVQVDLEAGSSFVIPDQDRADRFALS